jgi:hypothetical protein
MSFVFEEDENVIYVKLNVQIKIGKRDHRKIYYRGAVCNNYNLKYGQPVFT